MHQARATKRTGPSADAFASQNAFSAIIALYLPGGMVTIKVNKYLVSP